MLKRIRLEIKRIGEVELGDLLVSIAVLMLFGGSIFLAWISLWYVHNAWDHRLVPQLLGGILGFLTSLAGSVFLGGVVWMFWIEPIADAIHRIRYKYGYDQPRL